ncbi:hypothetical protein [Roseinatronobacter bogoriensis]|uniref:Uncharacterized protein n=1 Tax=Roseinatronobacter bogoriensis subsp. barguzinensis TaxID=441209 RepID=A0A2K8KC01_9RHOB|nr:hypothetical protein [Rhodobaca]ATX66944.1 hypothetical protein BG454_14890 [Rhodobaca barguzinensis]MBB4206435.1 hypothetical protein [Rhodobaca bogoriensis DSM 18756]TDW41179.1 hypothetical protein LY39_00280 [Rhodobaca barguzinensis]TDY74643.1 hypothetical protein EV660_101684 [Rhodobaca bogoriensis DSM 18756]
MQGPFIPDDVAEVLKNAEAVLQAKAKRLDRLLMIYGDGAEDIEFDDGEISQWEVSIEHGEVERLAQNLRGIAEFAGWLANFTVDPSDEAEVQK